MKRWCVRSSTRMSHCGCLTILLVGVRSMVCGSRRRHCDARLSKSAGQRQSRTARVYQYVPRVLHSASDTGVEHLDVAQGKRTTRSATVVWEHSRKCGLTFNGTCLHEPREQRTHCNALKGSRETHEQTTQSIQLSMWQTCHLKGTCHNEICSR